MLAAMAAPTAAVSFLPSFQQTYPIYRPGFVGAATGWPLWLTWPVHETSYAMRFVSVEFFFRGFMVHGTKHRFGSMAIFVMMVPYCMIHFGKPMAETFGAIGAGLVLGFTSLKTRSIWLGAAIHIGVAWTMDTLATWGR